MWGSAVFCARINVSEPSHRIGFDAEPLSWGETLLAGCVIHLLSRISLLALALYKRLSENILPGGNTDIEIS